MTAKDQVSEAHTYCTSEADNVQTRRIQSYNSTTAASFPSQFLVDVPSGGIRVPCVQDVVMTPIMSDQLNMQNIKIKVVPPKIGEVVVRVAWTGICRSDVCFSTGPEPGYPALNHIAGHEAIGHVVWTDDTSLLGCAVATRYMASYCAVCHYCLEGLPESCVDQRNFPKHYAGSYQQYMTVPWTSVMRLPTWVFSAPLEIHPATYTAALCSGSTALKAVQAANLRAGSVVVIVGIAGAIGHLAGMIAKNVYKAHVIGVDFAWKSKSLSSDADRIYDQFVAFPSTSDKDWLVYFEQLSQQCEAERDRHCLPRMADALIVTASSAAAFQKMENYVCDGGIIVCVGAPRGDVSIETPLCGFLERQLTMKGVMMGGDKEAYEVLNMIRLGLIKPSISEIPLSHVPQCIQGYLNFTCVGKIVVRVNGELSQEEAKILTGAACSPEVSP